MGVYEYKATKIDGTETALSDYKGKVLLVVNTASKCGFTPQYEDLQNVYKKYQDKGFEILAFPSNQFAGQEPGSNQEVQEFCTINFGVKFPLFEKVEVKGSNAHPLFQYLTENMPFNGLDANHSIGKILIKILEDTDPASLLGNSIKWNFTKFLIDREGNVVSRHEPTTSPYDMEDAIEKLL